MRISKINQGFLVGGFVLLFALSAGAANLTSPIPLLGDTYIDGSLGIGTSEALRRLNVKGGAVISDGAPVLTSGNLLVKGGISSTYDLSTGTNNVQTLTYGGSNPYVNIGSPLKGASDGYPAVVGISYSNKGVLGVSRNSYAINGEAVGPTAYSGYFSGGKGVKVEGTLEASKAIVYGSVNIGGPLLAQKLITIEGNPAENNSDVLTINHGALNVKAGVIRAGGANIGGDTNIFGKVSIEAEGDNYYGLTVPKGLVRFGNNTDGSAWKLGVTGSSIMRGDVRVDDGTLKINKPIEVYGQIPAMAYVTDTDIALNTGSKSVGMIINNRDSGLLRGWVKVNSSAAKGYGQTIVIATPYNTPAPQTIPLNGEPVFLGVFRGVRNITNGSFEIWLEGYPGSGVSYMIFNIS